MDKKISAEKKANDICLEDNDPLKLSILVGTTLFLRSSSSRLWWIESRHL